MEEKKLLEERREGQKNDKGMGVKKKRKENGDKRQKIEGEERR